MPEPIKPKEVGSDVSYKHTIEIRRMGGGLYTVAYNPQHIHQVVGRHNRFETVPFHWNRLRQGPFPVIAQFSFTQYDTVDELVRLYMERRGQKVEPAWETGINFRTWNVREELTDKLLDLNAELVNFKSRKRFSDYLMAFIYLGPQSPFTPYY